MLDTLLGGLLGLLTSAIEALPDSALPDTAAGVSFIWDRVALFDNLVPVKGPLTFMVGLLSMFPAFFALKMLIFWYGIVRGGGGDS